MFLLIDVFTIVVDENERRKVAQAVGIWPTPKIISEFLAPSRRIHPHVEPLLAPYKFFDKQSKGLNFFWAFNQCISPGDTSSLKSLVPFPCDEIPSTNSHYEASLIAKIVLLKAFIFPWYPCRIVHFIPFSLFQRFPSFTPKFPPLVLLNLPKIPSKP